MTFAFDVLEPAPLDPVGRADDGADARRRAPRHRRVPAGRPRPRAGRPRAPAVRQVRPLHVHAGARPALHRARLRVRRAGRARQVPLRGRDACPSPTRSTTATTRIDWIARQPWCDGQRRHVGRLLLRLHAVGGGGQRAPGAQGHRPARDERRPRGLLRLVGRARSCRCTGPTTWPTTGSTRTSTASCPTWTHAAAGASLRRGVRRHRRRAREASIYGRPHRAGERPPVPGQAPVRRAQGAGAQLGRLVRQHRAVLVRRLRGAAGAPGAARRCSTWSATPPTTRTTTCAYVPIGEENDHDVNDEALARMIPVYAGPGLDFFDVFLKGRGDAAAVPRATLVPRQRGVAHVAELAAAGGARAAPVPGRARARRGRGRGRRAPARGRHRRRRRALGARPRGPRAVDLVEPVLARCASGPTSATSQGRGDVLTFSGEPAAEPLDLAGPVSAWLTRRLELPEHARARQALRRLSGRLGAHARARRAAGERGRLRAPGRGAHEPHRAPPAARPPPASGHRLERLPALPLAPGYGGGPVARHRVPGQRAAAGDRRRCAVLPARRRTI